MKRKRYNLKLTLAIAFCLFTCTTFCQVQLQPWGNLEGIRIDGELMKIESNLTIIKSDSQTLYTAKERQRPHFERKGNQQIVTTNIDSIYFKETAEDLAKGKAGIKIEVTSKADESLKGIFFTFFMPEEISSAGSIKLNNLKHLLLGGQEMNYQKYLEDPADSIQFISKNRQYKITFEEPTQITIKNIETPSGKRLQVFIPVEKGDMKYGQVAVKNFSIQASGTIDKSPVMLQLNSQKTGRPFIGFGGNFRLQNPRTDPQVIDYCLKNLDVRFSRVEMPMAALAAGYKH